ncbi:hypothetical protein BWQ96_00390 [Gracilariopsis chorda]|uniref:Uncharacterized protein n=1 Tax=Gracilariopsis chorda TaxID=448386 RepID=A0A2V3J5N1_9FLOR|nr:hypothetical protein BWQ96_00390 [Gracilariopsis chorda]|eukprot:PXF49738.1 hypothetical protein BWQ96_00390 [Gracilariopsis chorda]
MDCPLSRVPGPAGRWRSSPSPSSSRSSSLKPQKRPSRAEPSAQMLLSPAWKTMLSSQHARKLPSSLALLRNDALQTIRTPQPLIPVIISSHTFFGNDTSLTLSDPTATIFATLHNPPATARNSAANSCKSLTTGTVLLLQNVVATLLTPLCTGFKPPTNPYQIHLTIHPRNIQTVFQPTTAATPLNLDPPPPPSNSSPSVIRDWALSYYLPHAASPPSVPPPKPAFTPVVKPRFKRPSVVTPPSRLPSAARSKRPRVVPHSLPAAQPAAPYATPSRAAQRPFIPPGKPSHTRYPQHPQSSHRRQFPQQPRQQQQQHLADLADLEFDQVLSTIDVDELVRQQQNKHQPSPPPPPPQRQIDDNTMDAVLDGVDDPDLLNL